MAARGYDNARGWALGSPRHIPSRVSMLPVYDGREGISERLADWLAAPTGLATGGERRFGGRWQLAEQILTTLMNL